MRGIGALIGMLCCLIFVSAAYAQDRTTVDTYQIQPSDVLEVSIYGEQDLVHKLVVRPDGMISFPLIGDIKAAGRSTEEIKKTIDEKIKPYIPEANSTVIVSELGSLKFYVIGKVNKPGVFNVNEEITVLQALSLAGGFNTFADENSIIVVRGHGENTQKIVFNYSEIKKGNNLKQNALLQRGDVVVVP